MRRRHHPKAINTARVHLTLAGDHLRRARRSLVRAEASGAFDGDPEAAWTLVLAMLDTLEGFARETHAALGEPRPSPREGATEPPIPDDG